jgi:hypothetical protein
MGQILSPTNYSEVDYLLRQRVLKLRWMGLESEAQELIAVLDHPEATKREPWRRRLPRAMAVTD